MKRNLLAVSILFSTAVFLLSTMGAAFAGSRPAVMSGHNGYSQQEMYRAVYGLVSGEHLWWCDNGALGNRKYHFDSLGGGIGYVEYVIPSKMKALFRQSTQAGTYYLHREADGCIYLDALDKNGKMLVQYMRVR